MNTYLFSKLRISIILLCSLIFCEKVNAQIGNLSPDNDSTVIVVNQLFNDTKDCLVNCFNEFRLDSIRVLITDDDYDIINGGIWRNNKGTMSSTLHGPVKIVKKTFGETHVLPMIDYFDSFNTEEHLLAVDSDSIGWMRILPLTETSCQKVIWGMPGGKGGGIHNSS